MQLRAEEISRIIKEQIEHYDREIEAMETGTVLTVGDGIARVYRLDGAMAGELLEFPHDVMGDHDVGQLLGHGATIAWGDLL